MNRSDDVEATLGQVADLYTNSLKEHGTTSMSVGWKDSGQHRLRFDKLAEVIDARSGDAAITVNDLGCGYGALFEYLEALPNVQLVRYHGYDISPEMLDTARRRIPDERAQWILAPEVTTDADYSFVSGSFNVKFGADDAEWRGYVERCLRALAARSRRGLAFNLLSSYVDWKEPHLYYADPLHFFDFCKQNVSRYVSLLHDYPLYEWTILVRLGESGS